MFMYNISVDTTGANTTSPPRPRHNTTGGAADPLTDRVHHQPAPPLLERGQHMAGVDRLTALDAETIVLLLSGYTVREIADRFNVTEKRIEKRRIRVPNIITGKD